MAVAPSPARAARALPRLLRIALNIKSLLLLIFVHDFELGVDDIALVLPWTFFLRTGLGPAGFGPRVRTVAGGGLLVKIGADFLELVLQVVVGALHRVGVVLLDRFPNRFDRVLDLLPFVFRNLVAEILELLLALVGERVGVVLDLDRFLRLLVFLGVGFSVALHLLDFFVAQARAASDGDLLLLAGAKVFRRDVKNAVCI